MSAWVPALVAGLAVALALPGRATLAGVLPASDGSSLEPAGVDRGWMVRYRLPLAGLAGLGAAIFLGGPAGLAAAPLAAAGCWVVIGRVEPVSVRREREASARDLPHVVRLFAAALAAGASPGEGLAAVVDALPGPIAGRLSPVIARLRLGGDPDEAWRSLEADVVLAPLGRVLARSQSTGTPVVSAVERLSEELSRGARAAVEERARSVGVKAAVPLGLCLLPAFLLIGIVPLVGGLLTTLDL